MKTQFQTFVKLSTLLLFEENKRIRKPKS